MIQRKHKKTVIRFCILVFFTPIVFPGCTTIGLPNAEKVSQINFGSPETIDLCILKDSKVKQERIDKIISEMKEEVRLYDLEINVPWIRNWERPGLTGKTIISDIVVNPLKAPCDRLMAFVSQNTGDFLLSLFNLYEYYGMVENETFTKGYSFAEWGTLTQILFLRSPSFVAKHEFYHMLGCGHHLFRDKCYDQIKRLKEVAKLEREAGNDFFPSMTKDGRILSTRDEVDRHLYNLIQKRTYEQLGHESSL